MTELPDGVRPLGEPPSIGGYQPYGKIDSGGQGTVYLARGNGHERVALKIFDDAHVPANLKRLTREVNNARRVISRYTAEILDYSIDGDTPFIVSEYVVGQTFEALVAAEGGDLRWSPKKLRRVAVQMLHALADIHGADVIHGDLSPRNVIMTDVRPVTVDFGLSRDVRTVTTGQGGTPGFEAPEEQRTTKSDLYSWAAVMVFLVTGRPPEPEAAQHWGRPLTEEDDLDRLIRRCLNRDPARRPTAKEALADIEHPPPPAPDVLITVPDKRPGPPRWLLAVAGAAMVCVVVLAIGVWGWLGGLAAHTAKATSPGPACATAVTRIGAEPVGFVDSGCLRGTPAAAVARQIAAENLTIGAEPYKTVVFLGALTRPKQSSRQQAIEPNPASLNQLWGVLVEQRKLNADPGNRVKLRVLLANAADRFAGGGAAAGAIVARARTDSSIVAVVGIGQSRSSALDAIRQLGRAGLAVIGTSVTGEPMMAEQNFFRISPGNPRQAEMAAGFATGYLHAHRVVVLANKNDPRRDPNLDLYSEDLAGRFTGLFNDATHRVVETCDYGEDPVSPRINCGGGDFQVAGLRTRICQDKADLILFAGRAVALPALFTARGGCDHLPAVLGSSDVPKYVNTADVRNGIAALGTRLYYASFAPAKWGGCRTPQATASQTEVSCDFIQGYRAAVNASTTSDDDAKLSFDSSDAMLAGDALRAALLAARPTAAQTLAALRSGVVAFDGASGRIELSASTRTPVDKPIYVTLLETAGRLDRQASCGRFSATASSTTYSPPLSGVSLVCPLDAAPK